ncbi:MAG: hypothetical protein WDZ61_00030 [Parcubacteria group bacterium]
MDPTKVVRSFDDHVGCRRCFWDGWLRKCHQEDVSEDTSEWQCPECYVPFITQGPVGFFNQTHEVEVLEGARQFY